MHPLSTSRKKKWDTAIVAVVLAITAAAVGNNFKASAQSQQKDNSEVPPGQEKQLYTNLRAHIPLKFKVDNLNSKRWAHELQIEVTNTSKKPIYFFHFFVTLPEITGSTGSLVAFWKYYGRAKLVDFATPLEPDDVPLQPGQKYTFNLTEAEANAWDYMRDKEGKPEPTKVVIEFQSINFGDSTGYDD